MRSRAVPRFENHLTNRAASVLGTGDGGSTQLLLLNGGFAAWDDADLPIADHPRSPDRCIYAASLDPSTIADLDYVHASIGRPSTTIVDARSAAEYRGQDVWPLRGDHIPGTVNLKWSLFIDLQDNGRRLT